MRFYIKKNFDMMRCLSYCFLMSTTYSASAQIVTPHTTHIGVAVCRSPKRAVELAKSRACDALWRWDREHHHCSSIGIEWLVISRNGNVVYSDETYIA